MTVSRTPQSPSLPSSARVEPVLKVTAFTDFICPFCYIGHVRLLKLRERYDLRVRWCLLEIHPDNPPEGRPVEELGYSEDQWRQMMANLEQMAAEEGIRLAPRRFTTNSRKALLLAEAAKDQGREVFYALCESLYRAYFVDARNIGDEEVLRSLARDVGLEAGFAERAWTEDQFAARLREHLELARRSGVRGTPTFIIGRRLIPGAVSTEQLFEAAAAAQQG